MVLALVSLVQCERYVQASSAAAWLAAQWQQVGLSLGITTVHFICGCDAETVRDIQPWAPGMCGKHCSRSCTHAVMRLSWQPQYSNHIRKPEVLVPPPCSSCWAQQ